MLQMARVLTINANGLVKTAAIGKRLLRSFLLGLEFRHMLGGPAFDFALVGALERQRIGSHVARDARRGADDRTRADVHRGHHHSVAAHEHVVADFGVVLIHAVIVASD